MIVYSREKKELIIPTGLGNLDNEIPYEEGYGNGYAEGNAAGRQEGYDNGYENGYERGVVDGMQEGIRSAYPNGFNAGVESGYTAGFGEGQATGYANGSHDGYESGYTSGFGEGEELGYTNGEAAQKAKLATLTVDRNGQFENEDGWNQVNVNVQANLRQLVKTPSWNDVAPHGVANYVASGKVDGWNDVIIDYSYVHNDGKNEGYESGYTEGYESGYTDGLNTKQIRIEGKYADNGNEKIYYFGDLYFNGEFVDHMEITAGRTYPLYGVGRNIDGEGYRHFWMSGFTATLSGTIENMDIDVAFSSKEVDVLTTDFEMSINDIPLNVRSSSRTLIFSATQENQRPQVIYTYHWRFEPINPSDYGIGFSDGYTSGYTDGAASASGGCRLDDNFEIFLTGAETNEQNPLHFRPDSEWFDGISEGVVYFANAYATKFNQGYQSGFTDGRGETELILQEKTVVVDVMDRNWNGSVEVSADSNYDGLSAVTVSATTYADYAQNVNNYVNGHLNGVVNLINESGDTLVVTANGTYNASATEDYDALVPNGVVTMAIPMNYKTVTVNVPQDSNLIVTGTLQTTADYVFSSADENGIFIYQITPIDALTALTIDNVPVMQYISNGLTLAAGNHTWWANYGELVTIKGSPVPVASFPNGTVSYGRIQKIITQ